MTHDQFIAAEIERHADDEKSYADMERYAGTAAPETPTEDDLVVCAEAARQYHAETMARQIEAMELISRERNETR